LASGNAANQPTSDALLSLKDSETAQLAQQGRRPQMDINSSCSDVARDIHDLRSCTLVMFAAHQVKEWNELVRPLCTLYSSKEQDIFSPRKGHGGTIPRFPSTEVRLSTPACQEGAACKHPDPPPIKRVTAVSSQGAELSSAHYAKPDYPTRVLASQFYQSDKPRLKSYRLFTWISYNSLILYVVLCFLYLSLGPLHKPYRCVVCLSIPIIALLLVATTRNPLKMHLRPTHVLPTLILASAIFFHATQAFQLTGPATTEKLDLSKPVTVSWDASSEGGGLSGPNARELNLWFYAIFSSGTRGG
jgi:hypothetical protein